MVEQQLARLERLLALNSTRYLFVRFDAGHQQITGALQGIRQGKDTLTCFFVGRGLETEVMDISLADLSDVVVFCDAERRPVFLTDFDSESGGVPSNSEEAAAGSGEPEHTPEQVLDTYHEIAKVLESLRE